jgi:hypothetical protein
MTVAQSTGAVSDRTCMVHRLQVRSVKVVQFLNCRVLGRAFERLERHESKGSRAVLRGLEGSNALRLPDPAQVRTPEVKTARVAQGVDDEARSGLHAGHFDDHFTPVGLELASGWGFKAHGGFVLPLTSFGTDVIAHHREATFIPLRLELTEYHHRIPHPFGQQLVALCLVGIQFTAPWLPCLIWCSATLQCSADRARMPP